MKKRFSEEQIIKILKSQEAGLKTAEVCREDTGSAKRPFISGVLKFFIKKYKILCVFEGISLYCIQ